MSFKAFFAVASVLIRAYPALVLGCTAVLNTFKKNDASEGKVFVVCHAGTNMRQACRCHYLPVLLVVAFVSLNGGAAFAASDKVNIRHLEQWNLAEPAKRSISSYVAYRLYIQLATRLETRKTWYGEDE